MQTDKPTGSESKATGSESKIPRPKPGPEPKIILESTDPNPSKTSSQKAPLFFQESPPRQKPIPPSSRLISTEMVQTDETTEKAPESVVLTPGIPLPSALRDTTHLASGKENLFLFHSPAPPPPRTTGEDQAHSRGRAEKNAGFEERHEH